MYWVNAAETHETVHWESGMRYHDTTISGGLHCQDPLDVVVFHPIACPLGPYLYPIVVRFASTAAHPPQARPAKGFGRALESVQPRNERRGASLAMTKRLT
jgi:hypothetical protein